MSALVFERGCYSSSVDDDVVLEGTRISKERKERKERKEKEEKTIDRRYAMK